DHVGRAAPLGFQFLPAVTYPFSLEGTGPFTVTPVSPTVLREDQVLNLTSVLPFPLTGGVYQGFVDVTITTFPDRLLSGTFVLSGRGGDALFGTYTVDTSVFTDPVDPGSGDFFGSEDFTGTFRFTGGAGRYFRAAGEGTYRAHSEWRPPTEPGTFFSGFTTATATGFVTVRAPGRWGDPNPPRDCAHL